jgi:hypothetical protein
MTLDERIAKLVHPQLGVTRGFLQREPDPPEKLIPVSVGELREVHEVLRLVQLERAKCS